MGHADFVEVFRGGTFRYTGTKFRDDARVHVRVADAGVIALESGAVLTCDPLWPQSLVPLAREVPRGRYPVSLALEHDERGEQVAAAMIRFAERDAIRWEMAFLEGQRLEDLGLGEIYGYRVRSRMGCFADGDLASSLEDNAFCDRIREQLRKTRVPDWSSVSLGSLVAFEVGPGDGFYASHWGFDDNDRVVSLATDFGMLTEPDEARVRAHPAGPFTHPELVDNGIHVERRTGKNLTLAVSGGRSCDVQLVGKDGKMIGCAMNERHSGDEVVYEFMTDATDVLVQFTILLGFRPLVRADNE